MPPLSPALSIFAAALLALALLAPPPASAAECPASIASLRPGDTCHYSSWEDDLQPILRPTQQGIGYAWVQSKLERKFQTAADAQAELKSSPIPVVVGVGGTALYCLDHHHTLMALELSGKHVRANVKVYVDVVCDYSDLADENAFWSKVRSRPWVEVASSVSPSLSLCVCVCVSLLFATLCLAFSLYVSLCMSVKSLFVLSLTAPRASSPFGHTLLSLLQDDSGPLRRPPIPPRGEPQPPAPTHLPVGSPADNQV